MGLLFVVAVISGIVVYGPFMRRLDFGTVRKKKSARVKWLDLHNLLGVVTLAWAFVVGFTGEINTLATPIVQLWQLNEVTQLLAPYKAKPLPTHLAPLNAAVATARAAAPPRHGTTLLLPQPLHFGDYGGMPMKIIWFVLDLVTIVVLGSGVYLWLGKRRTALDSRAAELHIDAAKVS